MKSSGFSTYTCEDGEQIHEWLTCGGSKDPSYKNMLDLGGNVENPQKYAKYEKWDEKPQNCNFSKPSLIDNSVHCYQIIPFESLINDSINYI